MEFAKGKHGQASDSPYWKETMAWIEAEQSRMANALTEEANAIAKNALQQSTKANTIAETAKKIAWFSMILAALALIPAIKELITWSPK